MKIKIEIDAGELASCDRRKMLAVSQLIGDICSAEISEAIGNVGKRFVLSDETAGIHGEYWADDGKAAATSDEVMTFEPEQSPAPEPAVEPSKPKRSVEKILRDYFAKRDKS